MSVNKMHYPDNSVYFTIYQFLIYSPSPYRYRFRWLSTSRHLKRARRSFYRFRCSDMASSRINRE